MRKKDLQLLNYFRVYSNNSIPDKRGLFFFKKRLLIYFFFQKNVYTPVYSVLLEKTKDRKKEKNQMIKNRTQNF